MSISSQDAAEALELVQDSARRSALLRGYQSAAPHLILWGCLWAVGYTGSYLVPRDANWLWLAISLGGGMAGTIIATKDRKSTGGDWRIFGLFLTFFAFIVASIAVLQPTQPNQTAAFIPLVVAVCYIACGLFGAPRLLITGLAVFILTLLGYFLVPAVFLLWMAVVGGGGLILGGIWLRRV